MSREGRAQPIQPFATHGFLGNTPANGVLPGRVLVVENDDRRRKTPPLQPVAINGIYATVVATVVQPPATVNVDRQDQRSRYLPLPAIVLSAALDSVTQAPTPAPPGPLVIPLDDRRRFLTPLPPTIVQGADDAIPPSANVVEPDPRRRYRIPLDPILLSAALFPPPQVVFPSGPYVVPLDERRRFLAALPTTSSHGFVDPGPGPVGDTPPPATSIDRADQRVRYRPLDPLILSGVLIPFVPPPPPVVLAGTDWAAEIAAW